MALSKYVSTRETTNLARIARIILGPCTGVLQDILRKEIVPNALSHNVKTFTANFPRNRIPPFNKKQEQLIYGGNYLDFDITLLYALFRNVCSIQQHTNQWGNDPCPGDRSVSANIERIRIIRNEYYGHVKHFSLSDADFEQKWKNIFRIVKELESYLGTGTDYQDALTELKTCFMNPDLEKAYNEKMLQFENLELEFSSLKVEVGEIKELSDILGLQRDADIFEQWQEDNKLFISTKACEEVERLTRSQNLVIVAGNSGSGKSAIIQHIALKYRSEGWVVKLVDEVKDIHKLYSSVLKNKSIFVLNDPIGKMILDEIAYTSWEKHEDRLKIYLKKIKLIMSCRKYILIDDRIKGLLKDRSNVIDINNDRFKLDNNEKKKIFNIHANGKKLSKNEYAEIRKIDEYFPLLCKMYFSKNRKQHDEMLTYFKEPIAVVEDEIRSFRTSCKEKYCALVLLALLNTVLSVNDLRHNENSRKLFKIALELSGMQENTPPHIIGDALATLNGYFVKKIGNTYQFYHDFVMEVTTLVFGTDYPTDAIKYADISFLRKRVRIESRNVENDRFTIYVGDEHMNDLGKRLFAELFGNRFLHVVLNPCLKNENIAKVLIKEFTDHPEKIELLLKKTELPKEEQEIDQAENMYFSKLSLLKLKKRLSPLCALVVFCNTRLSLHCLKALKQMQKDITDKSLYFAVCCNGSLNLLHLFSKDQLKGYMRKKWEGFSPIHIVSMFHNFEILLDLIPFGVDVNSSGERNSWTPTMLAAGNDTVEIEVNINNSSKTKRNKTIEILLRNGANINLCEESGKSALYIACQNGHDSAVLLLLRNGADINLCDKNGASPLITACNNGNYSTVQLLLSNGANTDLCFQNGFSPLFIACQNGHDSIVELLLSNGADINLCDKNGTSPLLIASQNGHDSTVELLLNNSADIDLCEKNGASPLSVACKNGHDNIVRSLLSKGASINLYLKNGATPLLLAIEDGHANTVQILLNNGADINSCTNTGCSPLSIACLKGYDTIVQHLLSNRADINICDKNRSSPLLKACFRGYDSIVQQLLSNGANINLCDKKGYSPLFIACEIGHESTVHLLLSNGADINLCLDNGASPLYIACVKGYESIVELLLSNGADTNLCEGTGASPLFVACKKGFYKIACLLVSKGADINLCEKIGGSPLFVACQNEHESIVRLLLSKGADINLCLKNGTSPLTVACHIGQKDIVKVLLSSGADTNLCEETGISPLYTACIKGDASTVQLLLCHGSDINLCTKNRISPLFVACENGHESIVQLLLFNRADSNLCKENGDSPLYRACEKGYENIVQLLLINGANINACLNNGASPLYIACQNRHDSIVHLLLSNGAYINHCLKNGASPLVVACQNGHNNIVQLLLSEGADINLREKITGASPIHIACDKGHDSIVQLLIRNGADINSCLENGSSPLNIACQNGHTCIVQLLLSKGTDINLREKITGASPIHKACDKERTGETYRLEPIASENLKDLFNSFNVEFPDDPLGESFVREILENEILQELVKTIHFLSNGIVLTTDIYNRYKKSSVEVFVFEIDVVNDGDQIIKDESPHKLERFLNWEEDNLTRIILITSKYISVVQAKLIVFQKYKHVIKGKSIFLQHVFDEFDEVAKLVANQRLSSFSTFVNLVLRCFTTDLYEIITEYTDELLTPEKIKQLFLKVLEDVNPKGNERNWGQCVADFIYKKIFGRGELVCADAWGEISTICRKTIEDLNIILMKLEEFQTNILSVDQNKQIEEWNKREVIRDRLELQKYPSIIKYIAGRRDDKKEVVKVYLSDDNEEATEAFVNCCEVSKDTTFEFVNVEKSKQSQKIDEIKKTERKPHSVDNSKRKELLQIIRKNRKKIYARHSNVIGIRIGYVRQKRDLMEEQTGIILYCLDKTLIPFGEKPLPDSIEGWPCDVREDFFMLGTCPRHCPSTNKDFPELGCSIGIHSKNGSGSVGFLYESRKYGSGFLTAAHVAIGNCHELHVDNRLLSNHPLGKEKHLIVHPSWSDNKKNNRTVGEVVESFYGEYKLSEELYEGLDFAAVKTNSCRVGDKDALDVINTDDLTYTEMVKKTGRSTGTTYGYLIEDVMFATVEYPPHSGTIIEFPELYVVKDKPETQPFFRKGDSGAGVFVMGNQDKPLGIGIAFSEQSSETYVCKINEIVKHLGLTIVKYREEKQYQASPSTQ